MEDHNAQEGEPPQAAGIFAEEEATEVQANVAEVRRPCGCQPTRGAHCSLGFRGFSGFGVRVEGLGLSGLGDCLSGPPQGESTLEEPVLTALRANRHPVTGVQPGLAGAKSFKWPFYSKLE